MTNLIILDRDGILNSLLTDRDGKPDSPMNAYQIEVFPWVPAALKELNDMGYSLAVATNQPAWAKGKVTYEALNIVHDHIIEQAEADGAKILSSHICFHQSKDLCMCRKPSTGLLEEAFYNNPGHDIEGSWMVGDRVTDVLAGVRFKLKTAWLGAPVADDAELMTAYCLTPTYRGQDLRDFVDFIKTQPYSSS